MRLLRKWECAKMRLLRKWEVVEMRYYYGKSFRSIGFDRFETEKLTECVNATERFVDLSCLDILYKRI